VVGEWVEGISDGASVTYVGVRVGSSVSMTLVTEIVGEIDMLGDSVLGIIVGDSVATELNASEGTLLD
jgi:hypothetical protein